MVMNFIFGLFSPIAVLLLGSLVMPLQAAELQTVNPEQLQQARQNGNVLVVDIRTAPEWQSSGVIPNSVKLQAYDKDGQFDQDRWLNDLQKLKTSPDQTVVLVCRSGNRSGKLGQLLTQQLGIEHVQHLNGGMQSWIKSGLPVVPDCPENRCQ